ncbi:MAG: hypothetical protein F4Z28_02650 [Gammaproteobacteria bacterium]|nr:hypothetical protein [Gammaproteobacteria bacterium]
MRRCNGHGSGGNRDGGIRREALPHRDYGAPAKRSRRYFALKLPIAADDKSATFVYVEPGRQSDTELQRWAKEVSGARSTLGLRSG